MTSSSTGPGLLAKLGAAIGGIALMVLGFMFSVVLLAIVVVVGIVAWGYFRWKTRHLRQTMKEQARNGNVIDGEAIVVEEYSVVTENTRLHQAPPP